jgi:hypothetical protein
MPRRRHHGGDPESSLEEAELLSCVTIVSGRAGGASIPRTARNDANALGRANP